MRRLRWFAWMLSVALLVSACEKDDEDRIDEFVEAVTGEVSEARVQHVLDHYVDLGSESLDVRGFGEGRVYDESDRAALDERARRGLGRVQGDMLRVLRRRIDIKGNEAYVELQLLGRQGMGNVRYELRKHGDRWLLSTVALQ